MKATGIVRRIDELWRVVIPKEIRKTLLKNLSGSSAFKSGKAKEYRVELDGDNFRIFTAKDSTEADRIGMEIAEELVSEFCEVSEVTE